MNFPLITISLGLMLLDNISVKLAYFINKKIKIEENQNIRWFFIHSISNIGICYYSINDLVICLTKPTEINNYTWNDNSYITFYISIILHIYHVLFFKLNTNDKLHHFLMVAISGNIELYQKSIICPAVLFFLSGLPGFIDYFLLFLVKLKKISKNKEKSIYLFLSTYIRAPGACILSYINLINLYNNYKELNINCLLVLLSTMLVFWNGQYYLMQTSVDYGKFIEGN